MSNPTKARTLSRCGSERVQVLEATINPPSHLRMRRWRRNLLNLSSSRLGWGNVGLGRYKVGVGHDMEGTGWPVGEVAVASSTL